MRNGTSGSPYAAEADWQAPTTEGTYTLSDSGTFMCGGRQSVAGNLPIQVTSVVGSPPVVDSLTAEPGRILVGDASALACAASDPDGDPLSYAWSTDGGQLAPGSGGAATFSSNQPGLFTVTCTATDALGLEGSRSIAIVVTSGLAEGSVQAGLTTPMRLAVNEAGELFVVDRGSDRIEVVDLHTGRATYSLALAGATAVAVDWAGRLLVGAESGARVTDELGAPQFELAGDAALGPVADVAVDLLVRRYAVLHPYLGRVAVYDETGQRLLAFGATGDGDGEFRGPRGLAFGPDGSIAVADTGHGLIQVFSAAGELQRSFGGKGGGVGKFVRLDDVEIDAAGRVYASDSFQDWVQVFDATGVARDTLGTCGDEPGQFKTVSGLAVSNGFARLIAASSNGARLELFRTGEPTTPTPTVASPALAPSSLVFAPAAVGTASAPQTLTLAKLGGSRLGLAAVRIEGDFTQTNDCGPVLEVGGACDLQVTFLPVSGGPRSGLLLIETSGQPLQVAAALSGEAFAAAPAVRLEPAALVFASQMVGTVSAPQTVQLNNVGTAPLTLAGITTSGEFAVSTLCPQLLPAGGGCPIAVSYAPVTWTDLALGALAVASNAGAGPLTVALSGSSAPAVPTISLAGWAGDEGAAGATTVAQLTISLSRSTSGPVEVAWVTGDASAAAGEDYEFASGIVRFAPGETARTIAVTVLGDALLEPDEEWFRVVLSRPVGALIADGSASALIRDDELCLGQNLLVNPGAESKPTADGCWLVDVNQNGNVDRALCFSLSDPAGPPEELVLQLTRFFTCGDTTTATCPSAVEVASTAVCAASANVTADRLLVCPGEVPDADTGVECSVGLADLGWVSGTIGLLQSCTYQSAQPNSNSSDCLVGFVIDPETGTNTPVELLSFSVD